MPTLYCPNGHSRHYRNTRGSQSAGTPCPECGEPMRGPTAMLCGWRGFYRWFHTKSVYRGACTEPKGHPTAPYGTAGHSRRGDPLWATADEARAW